LASRRAIDLRGDRSQSLQIYRGKRGLIDKTHPTCTQQHQGRLAGTDDSIGQYEFFAPDHQAAPKIAEGLRVSAAQSLNTFLSARDATGMSKPQVRAVRIDN
jgi:hypothetical protein